MLSDGNPAVDTLISRSLILTLLIGALTAAGTLRLRLNGSRVLTATGALPSKKRGRDQLKKKSHRTGEFQHWA